MDKEVKLTANQEAILKVLEENTTKRLVSINTLSQGSLIFLPFME